MRAVTFRHKGQWNAHCATVCNHQRGVLVAYYEGMECTDNQRVALEYWENDALVSRRVLPHKTGNCVLIPTSDNQATLIYSYFTDTDGKSEPIKPVQRWMFCTNWKSTVQFKDNFIEVGKEEILGVEPHVGLLPRCAPIFNGSRWLLPLYREHDCYGSIAESKDGWNWAERGRIGANKYPVSGRFGSGILIQPTIWFNGELFESLSRDITISYRAWYSTSKDATIWTTPIPAQIDNYNNSVVAIQDHVGNPTYLVWNMGHHRQALTLGRWDKEELMAYPIVELGPGSYPNYCWDAKDNLHIVFTGNRQIVHHVLDREALKQLEECDALATPIELGWKIIGD